MDIVAQIAEEKIREAVERGEMKNLPGKGKPLKLDNLAAVPEDLRPAYLLLKNAGVLPEELQLRKEIVSLKDLISCCQEDEKESLRYRLNEKILRFNLLMERRNKHSAALKTYRAKVYRKFSW